MTGSAAPEQKGEDAPARRAAASRPTVPKSSSSQAGDASDMDGPLEASVLTPAARCQIDAAVFDALGVTAGEREVVYAGLTELVETACGGRVACNRPTAMYSTCNFNWSSQR